MNPTNSIIGITHHVNEGSPVIKTSSGIHGSFHCYHRNKRHPNSYSECFLIPPICLIKMKVSSAIEVMIPLNIASIIIDIADQSRASRYGINWKAAIVPKSPILQPIKHHLVLCADCLHTGPSFQLNGSDSPSTEYPAFMIASLIFSSSGES